MKTIGYVLLILSLALACWNAWLHNMWFICPATAVIAVGYGLNLVGETKGIREATDQVRKWRKEMFNE